MSRIFRYQITTNYNRDFSDGAIEITKTKKQWLDWIKKNVSFINERIDW